MSDKLNSNSLLDTKQASAMLGIAPSTLKLWRHQGRGPAFIKLSDSKQAGVVYVEADVVAWRNGRRFASTSAYSNAAQANVKADIRRNANLNA